jgi:hypothetical protein
MNVASNCKNLILSLCDFNSKFVDFIFNIKLYIIIRKYLPQEAKVFQGVPGRLRLRICMTFGATSVVGRQLYAPGRLYHRTKTWYSFLEAESFPGHNAPSGATDKFPVSPTGIDSETARLVAQCLNH